MVYPLDSSTQICDFTEALAVVAHQAPVEVPMRNSEPFQAMAEIPVIPAAFTQGSRAKSKSALSMSLMAPPPAHGTAPR